AALEAAGELAKEGREIEVVDLRCLWPWDRETVLASVRKTGRLLIAHEAVRVGGFGAEIAAVVAEEAHGALKAPVRRVGSPRAPIAYAPPLEDLLRVTPATIARAARGLFA
ncbi:MAG: alpha-ketoacid dehydrogenase subunit beta, partial [Azospirillum sp.]|nr:alpha-ketoacid dehydrogenase subunit beta [Azospirillum sp.]